MDPRLMRRGEAILFWLGMAMLTVWGAFQFHSVIGSRLPVAQFDTDETANLKIGFPPPVDPDLGTYADLRSWSTQRVSAYLDSLKKKTEAPIAILRISRIGLKVPVFDGTDELTLNRGVGRIIGTAQVGGSGNVAIAGHRDGFFRALQNVARGDLIEVVQSQHTDTYIVRQTQVVAPEDVSVLGPTTTPTLTLVTCFPFYYIGHAPKRFVVTAHLKPSHHAIMAADPGLATITKRRRNQDTKPSL